MTQRPKKHSQPATTNSLVTTQISHRSDTYRAVFIYTTLMIGIDEVGRGCWAGPLLVVAAREQSELPVGLRDSKKLSKLQRQKLYAGIVHSCDIGEGWVSAEEIDAVGLAAAMRIGVQRALEDVKAHQEEQIVMDGTINYAPLDYTNVHCEARADDSYPIVSAASVYAKVARDTFMAQEADTSYPKYGFKNHVGYGTKFHSDAIKLYGLTPLHRRCFAPIVAVVEGAR